MSHVDTTSQVRAHLEYPSFELKSGIDLTSQVAIHIGVGIPDEKSHMKTPDACRRPTRTFQIDICPSWTPQVDIHIQHRYTRRTRCPTWTFKTSTPDGYPRFRISVLEDFRYLTLMSIISEMSVPIPDWCPYHRLMSLSQIGL